MKTTGFEDAWKSLACAAATKWITECTRVWSLYRLKLAENEAVGHHALELFAAPAYMEDAEWLYLETNGDPVPVACIRDGVLTLDDQQDPPVRDWVTEEPWVVEALLAIDPDCMDG